MKMKYKFNDEQQAKIKAARKANKNKHIDKRLEVLELRCKGISQKEISEKTGYHRSHVCNIIKLYFEEGLQAVTQTHYVGNRRNMSFEEEAEIIEKFKQKADRGQIIDVKEIEKAYQEKVDHCIGNAQIYFVLKRHGWRKIKPRSKHPKKASSEVIETSKKLTQK